MSTAYYRLGDTQLLAFASNMSARLNASPSEYFVSLEIAAEYQSRYESFDLTLSTALEPLTRTKANVSLKNDARRLLIEATRNIAGIVSTNPACTDAKLDLLGLSPRKQRTPILPPTDVPNPEVMSVRNNVVEMMFRGPAGTRGMPSGVAGISIFSHTGPVAPAAIEQWKFEANSSVPKVTLVFPDSDTARTVWLTAFFFNPRTQSGLACDPVRINLAAAGALPTGQRMKVAA